MYVTDPRGGQSRLGTYKGELQGGWVYGVWGVEIGIELYSESSPFPSLAPTFLLCHTRVL